MRTRSAPSCRRTPGGGRAVPTRQSSMRASGPVVPNRLDVQSVAAARPAPRHRRMGVTQPRWRAGRKRSGAASASWGTALARTKGHGRGGKCHEQALRRQPGRGGASAASWCDAGVAEQLDRTREGPGRSRWAEPAVHRVRGGDLGIIRRLSRRRSWRPLPAVVWRPAGGSSTSASSGRRLPLLSQRLGQGAGGVGGGCRPARGVGPMVDTTGIVLGQQPVGSRVPRRRRRRVARSGPGRMSPRPARQPHAKGRALMAACAVDLATSPRAMSTVSASVTAGRRGTRAPPGGRQRAIGPAPADTTGRGHARSHDRPPAGQGRSTWRPRITTTNAAEAWSTALPSSRPPDGPRPPEVVGAQRS
jgi:hypothetical protein